MTYQRFEDLPVWNLAIDLADKIYAFTTEHRSFLPYGLRDQIERAALSISNNIAEGFERGTTNELLAFLYIARGSAGETRSILLFIQMRLLSNPTAAATLISLQKQAEECSRQIRGWAEHLQNSEIRGQRHLNGAARQAFQGKQRAVSFQKKLRQMLPPDHPLRKGESQEQDE